MERMVQTEKLSKWYTRADGTLVDTVKDVNLEIYKGEIFPAGAK